MSEYIQINTTTDNKELALKIGDILVEQKLAACAQISGPIKSIYRWKGKIFNTQEWHCRIKTKKDLYHRVEEEIKALHPYEVPEIVVLPIIDGSQEYLDWIDEVMAE